MNKKKFILFFSQGFGTGLSPIAPGTCGSFLGIAWFALLLGSGNIWFFFLLQLLGFVVSIHFCGKAEIILGKSDPSSVVLDEIVALPLCFTLPVCLYLYKHGVMPGINDFFAPSAMWITALGFSLFRFFDIFKPWPISASQKLQGGLGITADDLLAAVYTSLILAHL